MKFNKSAGDELHERLMYEVYETHLEGGDTLTLAAWFPAMSTHAAEDV